MLKREHSKYLSLLRNRNVVVCSISMNQHLLIVQQRSMLLLPFINFSGTAWWEDAIKVSTRGNWFHSRMAKVPGITEGTATLPGFEMSPKNSFSFSRSLCRSAEDAALCRGSGCPRKTLLFFLAS